MLIVCNLFRFANCIQNASVLCGRSFVAELDVESGHFLRFVQLPLARCWSVESEHFLAFVQLASFFLAMEEEEPTSTGLAALSEKDYAAAERSWRRSKKKWLQKYPWLRAARHPGGHIALGCIACCHAGKRGPFGAFTYLRNPMMNFLLKQHERGYQHRDALNLVAADLLAPPLEHFREVYDSILERRKARCTRRKKLRKMQFCLTEGARQLDRDFLARSQSITLMQDARKSRLLVRFKASDKNLLTRAGILHQTRVVGDAKAVKEGTLKCILRACTLDLNPPHAPPWWRPRVNLKCYQRLLKKIEVFVSDAAADEQKAIN